MIKLVRSVGTPLSRLDHSPLINLFTFISSRLEGLWLGLSRFDWSLFINLFALTSLKLEGLWSGRFSQPTYPIISVWPASAYKPLHSHKVGLPDQPVPLSWFDWPLLINLFTLTSSRLEGLWSGRFSRTTYPIISAWPAFAYKPLHSHKVGLLDRSAQLSWFDWPLLINIFTLTSSRLEGV